MGYRGRMQLNLVLGGYHETFVNKKPQINADERRFVIAYLFIKIVKSRHFTIPIDEKQYIGLGA